MDFEFDGAKSIQNLAKHGIDFAAAQALWQDEERIIAPARNLYAEERQIILAQYDGKIWHGAFTLRNDKIRIISVRRARKNEETWYGQKN